MGMLATAKRGLLVAQMKFPKLVQLVTKTMSQRALRSQLIQQLLGSIEHLRGDFTVFEESAKTTLNFRFRKQESLHTGQGKDLRPSDLIL